MDTNVVRVKRKELLDVVKANLEHHVMDVKERQDSWLQELDELMVAEMEEAEEKDRKFNPSSVLAKHPFPEEQRDRYERVIDQLKWDTRQHLDLDHATFRAWIYDEWKSDFKILNGSINIGTMSFGGAITDGVIKSNAVTSKRLLA